MSKKRPINVSKEPDVRNASLDTGTSLNQTPTQFKCVPCIFSCLRELKMHQVQLIQINICFKLFPVSRIVNFASVEMREELMQEIYRI